MQDGSRFLQRSLQYLLIAGCCLSMGVYAQTPEDSLRNIQLYKESIDRWKKQERVTTLPKADSTLSATESGSGFICSSAQLAFGLDAQVIPGAQSQVYQYTSTGEVAAFRLTDRIIPRLGISMLSGNGVFEWYMYLPRNIDLPETSELTLYTGMETGFSVFPMASGSKRIEPFFGGSCMPAFIAPGGAGKLLSGINNATVDQLFTPLHVGLSMKIDDVRLTLSGAYLPQNGFDVYLQPDVTEHYQLSPFMGRVHLAYVLPSVAERTDNCTTGNLKLRTADYVARKKLSGLTLAIGLGQGYHVQQSPLFEAYPFLVSPTNSGMFLDLGLGLYIASKDIQVNYSYRRREYELDDMYTFSYTHPKSFYQFSYIARTARTFEVYKFWYDWSGIAFFAGPAISIEDLHAHISYNLDSVGPGVFAIYDNSTSIQPGISAGWEFRPDRLKWVYLRSTIRWMPFLAIDTENNGKFYADQLEFTGIQLFILPFRWGRSYRGL